MICIPLILLWPSVISDQYTRKIFSKILRKEGRKNLKCTSRLQLSLYMYGSCILLIKSKLGVVGAILTGFWYILSVGSYQIFVNLLVYAHLCKQTSYNNINFEFFSQIISCVCKTSILTQILPYQNNPIPWVYSDMPLYFKK